MERSRDDSSPALVGYDNLMRQLMLQSGDDEFLKFTINQEECRNKWLNCDLEVERVRQQITEAEHLKTKLEAKNHHVHGLLQGEVRKRLKEQQEKKEVESKLELIRSTLCDDDAISVDTTEKLKVFLQPKSKRSLNFQELATIDEVSSVTSSSFTEKSDEELELSGLVRSYRDVRRSLTPLAESRHPPEGTRVLDEKFAFDGQFAASSTLLQSPQGPSNPTPIFGNKHVTEEHHEASRKHPHLYKKHTVLHSVNCRPCGLRFGRAALKCGECGQICHVDCEEFMPSCNRAAACFESKKKKTVTFFSVPANNR